MLKLTLSRFVFRPVMPLMALMLAAPPAFGQSDSQRIEELARRAAEDFAAARTAVLEQEGRTHVPPPPPGTVVALTLDEATERALDRNLELAVERLNPQLNDLNILRIRAAYRPTLNTTFNHRATSQPSTSQLDGGERVQNDNSSYNASLSQAIPWSGGNASVQFNNNRQATTNVFANFNPSYTTGFTASVSQPLLRGLFIDGTRQQLRVSAINREMTDIQLRATVLTTIANVRNSYWELLYAVQALDVARGSLELAEKLVQDNRARVEVGTMAPTEIVSAEAEVAQRRLALTQAEATVRTTELSFKRLIVSGTDDPLWRSTIDPIDRPEFRPEPIDVEAAVRRALDIRTDVAQARKTIEQNDVQMRFMRNQTLPDLNLNASYGSQGRGGTEYLRAGSGLGSTITGTNPGGITDAWGEMLSRTNPTWNVSLNFSLPLGRSANQVSYARARVQLGQSAAQLRALELQVATEVTNAALQVDNNLRRYEAALASRQLSQTRLQTEQSRFDVGLSTNYNVVQAQRDLANAQNAELRALLDYRRALVEYERVQEAAAGRGGIGAIN
jgi:outer membrane protein